MSTNRDDNSLGDAFRNAFGFQDQKEERRVLGTLRGDNKPLGSGYSETPDKLDTPKVEYTGGSVSYYTVAILHPTTPERSPYTAECNDIIEALGMNYAEGNAFKAIWRMCAARKGLGKKGYDDGLYDAEKVAFFGNRMIHQAKYKV